MKPLLTLSRSMRLRTLLRDATTYGTISVGAGFLTHRNSYCDVYVPRVRNEIVQVSLQHSPLARDILETSKSSLLTQVSAYVDYIQLQAKKMMQLAGSLIRIFIRSLYLSAVFTPTVLSSPLLLIDHPQWHDLWWDICRYSITISGPCLTKFGQWVANRPDIFPKEVCERLSVLQSRVNRYSPRDVVHTLDRELGADWTERFNVVMDQNGRLPKVFGTGCIAQVFKGSIKVDQVDRPIAIKVVHPGIKSSIESDIEIMRFFADTLELLPGVQFLSLSECVDEFASLMFQQIDMQNEAVNLLKFRHNFDYDQKNLQQNSLDELAAASKSFNKNISFPVPIYPYVTKDYLIESFEEGRLMAEMFNESKEVKTQLALLGINGLLKMVFEDNRIHADLHPGNIIVKRSPTDPDQFQLSVIDGGLVVELPPAERRNFVELFKAVVTNNGKLAGRLMIERSRDGTCIDPVGFERDMSKIISDIHESGLFLRTISVASVLQSVLLLCYKYQVKLESKFASVIIAVGILEGLGRRLDPDIDIMKYAVPYVIKAAMSL